MTAERRPSADFLGLPGTGARRGRRPNAVPWIGGLITGVVGLGVVAVGSATAHGTEAGRVVLVYFAPVLALTVVSVLLVARWVTTLRQQLLWAGVVASAGTFLGVVVFVQTMFLSRHDAYYAVLISLTSLVVTGWSVSLFFGRALRRVEAAERARSEMIAAISHDLRTPLTSLRLLSQALQDGLGGPDDVREIQAQVRSLGALLDDLFELADLEAGERRIVLEPVELGDLVMETLDALRPQARAGTVDLRDELPSSLSAVTANPEQLQRVLFNLLQNAIRHASEGGEVVISAGEDDRAVVIEVSDSGPGVALEERGRIFDAFYQGGERSARGHGSGLGLAIARAIVEAHGGRIWLAPSGRTSGATFCFSLMKAPESAPGPLSGSRRPQPAGEPLRPAR